MPTVATEQSPIEVLETRLEDLLGRYERATQENGKLEEDLSAKRKEITDLNQESREQRQEISGLRAELAALKQDNASLKQEGEKLKEERDLIKERINKLIGQVDEHLQQLI